MKTLKLLSLALVAISLIGAQTGCRTHRRRRGIRVRDHAAFEGRSRFADAGRVVRHRAGRDALRLQQIEPGDAGTVEADAGVVEHRQPNARLQREAPGADAAMRAADHHAASTGADGLGDAVDQQGWGVGIHAQGLIPPKPTRSRRP